MKNIIIITDGINSNMVKKSLKPDVNVLLYLEFQKYWELSDEEMQREKEAFIGQMLLYWKNNRNSIDYVFSFVARRALYRKEELADWILRALREMEIPEDIIVDGWRIYRSLYPREEYARKLENPKMKKLDGVVFGISHAEAGIRADFLPGDACNFASSSQDIYFNYFTAQRIWNRYYEKVKDIKYAVIEMFDYTYFNFETMYTGATLNFFHKSGIECPKEYDSLENKNLTMSAAEINNYLRTKWAYSSEKERRLVEEYFENLIENDENAYHNHNLVDGVRKITEDEIEQYRKEPSITSIQVSVFEKSIEKNVKYMYELLRFLYERNPEIKIILCLIPKYKVVEEFESATFADWKIFFEKILSDLQQKIPFTYLNFKEDEEISARKDFYWDMTHLNDDGACVFSKKLGNRIAEILEDKCGEVSNE